MILGLIFGISICFLIYRLPLGIRMTAVRHPIATDVLVAYLIFKAHDNGSVEAMAVSIVATAVVAVFLNMLRGFYKITG